MNPPPPANPGPDPAALAGCGGPEGFPHLLQSLLDGIPNPLVYQDLEGRYLGCNRAFEASAHIGRGDLAGKTLFDLLPPEEARRIRAREQEIQDSGGTETYLDTVRTRDQGVVQVLVTKSAFTRPDGSLAGLLTSYMDVTEQKRAEEALQRSQHLLSTITRNVTDLVAILDATGRRLYASPSYQTVLGYDDRELEATASLALVHPDDLPRIRRALEDIFEQGLPCTLDYRLRHRDGRWLDFEARANPIRQVSGKPSQAVLVARDVTARKIAERSRQEMEIRLRHAQKLESIGSLAAGIAHEINTPTQFIGDNVQFLQGAFLDLLELAGMAESILDAAGTGGLPPDLARRVREALDRAGLEYLRTEVPKAFAEAFEGVRRVAAIVGAMKDFSHPGATVKTPTDLNRAIQSTVLVCRSEWKYVAALELDLDPELPPVLCLPDEFNQVILNLVINAAHAIVDAGRSGSGRIRIATRSAGDRATVEVEDTGTGIPDAIRPRIFDPFFTTKEAGRGTGQGLAIAHAVVVEQLGGTIEVRSEVGRGTAFIISLPWGEPVPALDSMGPEAP
jgi:PAS domain S-box-containing protein